MSNILVIKHGSLGDISQISGVLKDIKETYNDKKIFILTTLPYVELLSKCPYINGVLIDKRLPRWNFLLLAINQLVNHLDKINIMSNNGFKTKTIIRTGIGSQRPLHPQYQHIGDFTEEVSKMCTTIEFIKLNEPKSLHPHRA